MDLTKYQKILDESYSMLQDERKEEKKRRNVLKESTKQNSEDHHHDHHSRNKPRRSCLKTDTGKLSTSAFALKSRKVLVEGKRLNF